MKKMANITKKRLIDILDKDLFGWAYKQIEEASISGTAKLAGFILGACFIDAMAGFYAGIDKKQMNSGSSGRFKKFVAKYLPKYDKEKLYKDLRCGLVHSYVEGGTYAFTDANKDGFHFNKTPKGRIILNLEDFCADLREAYRSFRQDILDNDAIFKKAKHRYETMKLMRVVPLKNA